jgi:hypothetical protein
VQIPEHCLLRYDPFISAGFFGSGLAIIENTFTADGDAHCHFAFDVADYLHCLDKGPLHH